MLHYFLIGGIKERDVFALEVVVYLFGKRSHCERQDVSHSHLAERRSIRGAVPIPN